MKPNNRFFVLKSNLDASLSNYSYNANDGSMQELSDTYGFPTPFIIGSARVNTSQKPIFIPASDLIYSNIEIICFDTNNNYLGYRVDSIRYSQGKRIIELIEGTYSILVNFNTPDEDYTKSKPRTWFYVGYEVVPHYKKLELQNKKESNQIFFRQQLSGTVSLFGDDYKFVNSASLEQNMLFAIYVDDTILAKNTFNKTDCKYDHAKCSVQLKLSPEDRYTSILNKYDNTYDIIKLSPAISRLILTKRMAYQVYIAGANNITTIANGTYWEEDVNEPISDLDELNDKYYFSKMDDYCELHLEGFNYSINSSYIVDGSSDTWNATSKVISYASGEPVTYLVQACIRFEKEYSAGSAIYGSIYRTARKISDGGVMTEDELFISGELADMLRYDVYRIYIYTGPNGTGDRIYRSTEFYVKDKGDFKISAQTSKYAMTKISVSSPMMEPTPANFYLGDNVVSYAVCARIVCDVEQVELDGTTYNLYDIPSDDFVYNRANYKKCIGIILQTRQVRALSSKPTKYGMDDYRDYFTSNFLNSFATVFGKPIPVSRSAWANTSIWVLLNYNWQAFESKFRKQYTLKEAYAISDVISAMLVEIDPRIKHEGTSEYSQFLYGASSPLSVDTARNGYGIYISPKSNVLKGNYDQAAQKAELTFEQLMGMLRDCFRCYWFIDEYNRFRVEHVSYFLNGMSYSQPSSQFDLSEKFDKFNKKSILYCQQELEFVKEELQSRYEFDWMDDCTDFFGNNSIDVKSKYIQQNKTGNISANIFSADVDLMLYAPDKFSSDGFVLLVARNSDGKVPIVNVSTFKDDEYLGPLGNGQYDGNPQNFLASWLYLMRYYTYDMPATNIEYNGIVTIDAMRVKGIKRCMKHEIQFPSNFIDIDLNRLITTEKGNGYIEEMTTNIDNGLTKIELRYEPS